MFTAALSWLGGLLGGPFAKAAVDAYRAKLAAGNDAGRIAADLAKRELEVQQREAELRIDQLRIDEGRWWTAAPRAVVMWSFAIFTAKVVVYDKVLAWGTTDPLTGDVATWAGAVMCVWFGGRTAEKIARILRK